MKFCVFRCVSIFFALIGVGACVSPLAAQVPIFKANGIKLVIRLNKSHYDRRPFTMAGIRHVDLYYPDGSNPSDEVLQEFLKVRLLACLLACVRDTPLPTPTPTHTHTHTHTHTARVAANWTGDCAGKEVVVV